MPSKVGGGPVKIFRTAGKGPWQLCEREPVMQATTNRNHHTEATAVEKLAQPNTYHEPIPTAGGKGWALNWQNRWPKQRSTKINRASKHVKPEFWAINQKDVWAVPYWYPGRKSMIKWQLWNDASNGCWLQLINTASLSHLYWEVGGFSTLAIPNKNVIESYWSK